MRWKTFIQQVEKQLKAQGIDPETNEIEINYIDFADRYPGMEVIIDLRDMPASCDMIVED